MYVFETYSGITQFPYDSTVFFFILEILLQDILQYNSASERSVEFTTTSQPRQISVVFPLMTSVNESPLGNMSGGESGQAWISSTAHS